MDEQIEALKRELAVYEARGMKDRAAQVQREIKRLGGTLETTSIEAPETTSRPRGRPRKQVNPED